MMNSIGYYFYKFCSKFGGNSWIIKYYRKCGIQIGKGTRVFSRIITSEPYLIEIGEHTTISTNVSLLTHDASVGALGDREKESDLCGKIRIGNHCFIGNNCIILYGCSIADGCIVAAGSVVTKSVLSPNVIIGGNPAKVIGSTQDYIMKHKSHFYSLHGLNAEQRKEVINNNPDKLVKR